MKISNLIVKFKHIKIDNFAVVCLKVNRADDALNELENKKDNFHV